MEGQVSEKIKSERSARLIALGEEKRKEYEKRFIGKKVEVLVEEDALVEGRTVQVGYTREYMKIALETKENLKNSIIKVQIENGSQIIR